MSEQYGVFGLKKMQHLEVICLLISIPNKRGLTGLICYPKVQGSCSLSLTPSIFVIFSSFQSLYNNCA
jgi:hypothetical protein